MISEIKRKSLPAIAKAVGLDNQQSLHHFLTESPSSAQQLRQRRLELMLKVVDGRTLILLIDETGDCKKGTSTDYVKRQYIGNVGKKENGIVAVTAYGLVDGMILPLTFEVYKPRERLKDTEQYQSKPQIASQMIRQLQAMGFQFELVLADSLYGESMDCGTRRRGSLPRTLAGVQAHLQPWHNGSALSGRGDLWQAPSQAVLVAHH
jgi:SRSO17 transposase